MYANQTDPDNVVTLDITHSKPIDRKAQGDDLHLLAIVELNCPPPGTCTPVEVEAQFKDPKGNPANVTVIGTTAAVQQVEIIIPGDSVRAPELRYQLVARSEYDSGAGTAVQLTASHPLTGQHELAVDHVFRFALLDADGSPADDQAVEVRGEGPVPETWTITTDDDGVGQFTVPSTAWLQGIVDEQGGLGNLKVYATRGLDQAPEGPDPDQGGPLVARSPIEYAVWNWTVNHGDGSFRAVVQRQQDLTLTMSSDDTEWEWKRESQVCQPQEDGEEKINDTGTDSDLSGHRYRECHFRRTVTESMPLASNLGPHHNQTSGEGWNRTQFSYASGKKTVSDFGVKLGLAWVRAEAKTVTVVETLKTLGPGTFPGWSGVEVDWEWWVDRLEVCHREPSTTWWRCRNEGERNPIRWTGTSHRHYAGGAFNQHDHWNSNPEPGKSAPERHFAPFSVVEGTGQFLSFSIGTSTGALKMFAAIELSANAGTENTTVAKYTWSPGLGGLDPGDCYLLFTPAWSTATGSSVEDDLEEGWIQWEPSVEANPGAVYTHFQDQFTVPYPCISMY